MIASISNSGPELSDRLSYLPNPTKPRVSFITPNYNHTRYISAAIDSVLDQTYRSFEIIVVDDGSTDNSREVVAGFGDQVRYIWQENQGLGGARNTGIRASQSELIGLLDADDQWLPTFLETMVALADQHSQAAVYYCCARGMDIEGHDLPQVFGGPVGSPDILYRTLLRANFLIPSTILMRRSSVMKAGMFEQTLRSIHGCEDWDLWLRIAPDYDFVGTPECLVRYRLHGSTFSADPDRMQQAVRAVTEKHFGPDDGRSPTWSQEKRRAYGGVYRYHLLTSVQRQEDWDAGALYLRQALRADPTLAVDLNLFYDLALGSQPPGQRGTPYQLNLEENANHISSLLSDVFGSSAASELESVRRQTYGTAHYALGLVAYNAGQISPSRRFLLKALYYRPELSRDGLAMGNLVKSLINRSLLERIRKYGVQARN
jgi:glycosyltransferase involved in cell wall biosynthesis